MAFPERLVEVARTELALWVDDGLHECEKKAGRIRVAEYWKSGLGLEGLDGCSKSAWSAAFVCFCMREADMPLIEFAFGQGHHTYIRWAIENTNQQKQGKTYYGRRREDRAPQPGDLIAGWRKNKKTDPDPDPLITFDFQPDTFYPSHCDIVVENKGTKVVTVGGNVSNRVKITEYPAEGGILKPFKQLICVLECVKP